jgi:hypothetical protein
MHRGWLGGCNRVRHKSRRPRLRVGNATPSRGEGVPHRRKRPTTTLLRLGKNLVNGSFSHISLSRRCHFQDVQYHFSRLRVSVDKVNVYKVEARRNRDLSVSRPWHIFVLLTVVDTRLLCPTNRSHAVSRIHYRTRQPSNAFELLRQLAPQSRRSQSLRGLRRPQDHYLGHHGRFPNASAIPSR